MDQSLTFRKFIGLYAEDMFNTDDFTSIVFNATLQRAKSKNLV